MSTTMLARPRESFPVRVSGLTITPAAPSLWRVSRAGGAVLGHIERRQVGGGLERWAARRIVGGGIRSTPLGEFWSPGDAAECFR